VLRNQLAIGGKFRPPRPRVMDGREPLTGALPGGLLDPAFHVGGRGIGNPARHQRLRRIDQHTSWRPIGRTHDLAPGRIGRGLSDSRQRQSFCVHPRSVPVDARQIDWVVWSGFRQRLRRRKCAAPVRLIPTIAADPGAGRQFSRCFGDHGRHGVNARNASQMQALQSPAQVLHVRVRVDEPRHDGRALRVQAPCRRPCEPVRVFVKRQDDSILDRQAGRMRTCRVHGIDVRVLDDQIRHLAPQRSCNQE